MDDGVKLAGTVALALARRPDAARRAGSRWCWPPRRTAATASAGASRPSFWATRGMVGAVFDVRGTGGSGGNLDGNFFSPREARDGYHLVEYLGTSPYSTGKVGMAGRLVPGHHAVPGRRAAAAAPGGDHPGGRDQRPLPRGLRARRHPEPQLRRSSTSRSRARPARPARTTTRSCSRRPLQAKLGQSPPGTIAFDYLARPNDDRSTATGRRSTAPTQIKVPALIIGGLARRAAARRARDVPAARAPARGRDPPVHRPLHAQGLRRSVRAVHQPARARRTSRRCCSSSSTSTCVARRRRPAHRCATTSRRRNRFVDADRWPPAGTGSRRVGPGRGQPVLLHQPRRRVQPRVQQVRHRRRRPRSCPTDQRLEGPQGVTFRTPALDSALDVIGPTRLRLVASSTATDTDWHAKLSDVAPGRQRDADHRGRPARLPPRARSRQEHAGPPVPPPHQPAADRAEPLLRLRHRDRADRLPARARAPAPAARDLHRPADPPPRLVRLRPQPAPGRAREPALAGDQHASGCEDSYLALPAAGLDGGGVGVCLSRRSPIGPRNIGRIRLGYTRARLLRVPVRAPRRTARSLRYCVKGSRGRVTAVFSSRSRAGPGEAGGDHRARSRQPARAGRLAGEPLPPRVLQARADRARSLPRAPWQPAHLRAPPGARALHRGGRQAAGA